MAASHFVDVIDEEINNNYCFKENAYFSNNHLCSYNIRGGLMVSALDSESSGPGSGPGARFSNVPITFRARKAMCETANAYFGKLIF